MEPTPFIDSSFIRWFGFFADIISTSIIIGGLAVWKLTPDKQIAAQYKVNKFMTYVFRSVLIIIFGLMLFGLLYMLFFYITVADDDYRKYNFFNPDYPMPWIIAWSVAGGLFLVSFTLLSQIIWTFSWDPVKLFMNIMLPPHKKFKPEPPLEIISAEYKGPNYGYIHTDYIKRMVIDNKLVVMATNGLFGEPEHGKEKVLIVEWRYGDKFGKSVVPEGDVLTVEKGVAKLFHPPNGPTTILP